MYRFISIQNCERPSSIASTSLFSPTMTTLMISVARGAPFTTRLSQSVSPSLDTKATDKAWPVSHRRTPICQIWRKKSIWSVFFTVSRESRRQRLAVKRVHQTRLQ